LKSPSFQFRPRIRYSRFGRSFCRTRPRPPERELQPVRPSTTCALFSYANGTRPGLVPLSMLALRIVGVFSRGDSDRRANRRRSRQARGTVGASWSKTHDPASRTRSSSGPNVRGSRAKTGPRGQRGRIRRPAARKVVEERRRNTSEKRAFMGVPPILSRLLAYCRPERLRPPGT